MSQINVNTIGARTGTTISIASGHTLDAIALSLVTSGSVSAVTGLTLDNVFTSSFTNYLFQFNGTGDTNNIEQTRLRLRASSSTNTDSDHSFVSSMVYREVGSSGANGTPEGLINESYFQIAGNWMDNEKFVTEITFIEPQVSGQGTSIISKMAQRYNQGTHSMGVHQGVGVKNGTGSFDGFYFYVDGSQTITGNYRLYGYK